MQIFWFNGGMGLWMELLDFVYPKFCVGCGEHGSFLCEKCFGQLDIAEQICPMCGCPSAFGWTHRKCIKETGLDGLICIYSYEDEIVKKAIDDLKFGFIREMAGLMIRDFTFESGINFDYIVPLPLHFYRENWRGFNQSKLIADIVGKAMGVKTYKCLERSKNTKQQASLRLREDRERNLKNAFRLSGDVKGKNVLLIDDVFTSGMSMREAAATLKRGGAKFVWGLVLAH